MLDEKLLFTVKEYKKRVGLIIPCSESSYKFVDINSGDVYLLYSENSEKELKDIENSISIQEELKEIIEFQKKLYEYNNEQKRINEKYKDVKNICEHSYTLMKVKEFQEKRKVY